MLGVSGSIAAYKSALLVRLLIKEGAEVQVIMTESAHQFVTPLTLGTLSKRPVYTSFTQSENGTWNNHVDLGLWGDVMIIAPATARTLAKFASGNCDDLLTAVYLSARCPVFIAPAMDVDMYKHPSTRKNLESLQGFGNIIVDAEYGELASGLTGEGRLAEPEQIVSRLIKHFAKQSVATNKRVLITAGPTVEPIDPVRFISNRSSGKMGYAIAKAFAQAGAQVTLISGPTNLNLPDESIGKINVETANEMFVATKENFEENDLIIFSAAVADYTPTTVSSQKIKKKGTEMKLELTKTDDIAGVLGQHKKEHQLLIGFALETEHEIDNALDKLRRKNFDYIVLNSLNDAGSGFAHDTNKITVIDKLENVSHYSLKSKQEVAEDILQIILNKWSEA